jgi:hypothetical protein
MRAGLPSLLPVLGRRTNSPAYRDDICLGDCRCSGVSLGDNYSQPEGRRLTVFFTVQSAIASPYDSLRRDRTINLRHDTLGPLDCSG